MTERPTTTLKTETKQETSKQYHTRALQQGVTHYLGCSHCLNTIELQSFENAGKVAFEAGWRVFDGYITCPQCMEGPND